MTKKYLQEELDELAKWMLNPDKNFNRLLEIWNNQDEFKISPGRLND